MLVPLFAIAHVASPMSLKHPPCFLFETEREGIPKTWMQSVQHDNFSKLLKSIKKYEKTVEAKGIPEPPAI
jgi:hypothetical protein